MKSNIGLKKVSAEAGSAVLIKDDSRCQIRVYKPRVTRAKTLDLGSVVDNQGYSEGDREITIISSVSEELAVKIVSMVQDETHLLISTRDGVFYGSIDNMSVDRGSLNLKFLSQERDDA